MSAPLPTRMRALCLKQGKGALAPLNVAEAPLPSLCEGEALIRVHAAGVNRADLFQRQGLYPLPEGALHIPGLEVAGEIAALSGDIKNWNVGDAVCAITSGSAYAEYVAVPATLLMPVPKNYDMVRAAALPEACFTAWMTLVMDAGLLPGETALIHGGTSGVGTLAIQIAKALGARVVTTAGTAEKCWLCRELGVDLAVQYREQDFVSAVKDFTGGKGADVILDMVGGDYIERNMKAAAEDGRIIVISFLKGAKAEVNFAPLLMKRLTMKGSTLRWRSLEQKSLIAEALRLRVWPLLEEKKINPVIDGMYPLSRADQAHERMASGVHSGKMVLTLV